METLLYAALSFLGTSIAGGITWDVIKSSGQHIIRSFKTKFVSLKFINSEEDAEKLMKAILQNEPYNINCPLDDIWNLYYKYTGRVATEEFQDTLKDWLLDNVSELNMLVNQVPKSSIYIGKQTIKDNANVTFIGTQFNSSNPRRDK